MMRSSIPSPQLAEPVDPDGRARRPIREAGGNARVAPSRWARLPVTLAVVGMIAALTIPLGGCVLKGTHDEVVATLADLHAVGVDIVTLGQYLRPTTNHLPIDRWWHPDEFAELKRVGEAMGIPHIEASPLTRSSYHARQAESAASSSV